MGRIRGSRKERAAPYFARLCALRRIDPRLDRERAEAAFAEHLRLADLSARPLRWFDDAEEATLALRAAGRGALDRDWLGLEWRSTASLRLASLPPWSCADDIRPAVTGDWDDFSAWHVAWSVHDADVFRIAARVAFPRGDVRDSSQCLRAVPLLAVLASEWRAGLSGDSTKWLPLLDAAEAGLWAVAVCHDFVVAVGRPTVWSEPGVLHCGTGPAVTWPGGARWYCWRGARVPRHAIENPESLQLAEILHSENNDPWLRNALVERYGLGRFMLEFCRAPVQQDKYGGLFRVPLGDEQLVAVRVLNATPEPDGTRRVYWLRVPPDVATARQGVAWTFGLAGEDYEPTGES